MLLRGLIETSDIHIHGALKIRGTAPGFFIRGKTTHHGMNDPRSRAVGNVAARIAESWKTTMTGSERNAWEIFAAANPTRKHSARVVTLNGFQVFSKYQHTRTTLGLAMSTSPPSGVLHTEAPLSVVNLTFPGVLLFQFDNSFPWSTDPTHVAILVDTGPANATVQNSKAYSRIAGSFTGIPIVGYPSLLAAERPYPPTATGGTVFTYLVKTS